MIAPLVDWRCPVCERQRLAPLLKHRCTRRSTGRVCKAQQQHQHQPASATSKERASINDRRIISSSRISSSASRTAPNDESSECLGGFCDVRWRGPGTRGREGTAESNRAHRHGRILRSDRTGSETLLRLLLSRHSVIMLQYVASGKFVSSRVCFGLPCVILTSYPGQLTGRTLRPAA